MIGGKPVPYCLAHSAGGEVRGNLAAGGKGVAQPRVTLTGASPSHRGRYWPRAVLLLVGWM